MDQRAIERAHVGQHLLLHDDGALVLVNEFNRVFDGDDLAAALAVDEVHEVIERGGFARAGRAGDQHQAVGLPRQVVNFFRQAQFLARGDALAAKAETHFRMAVAPVKSRPDAPGHAVQQRNAKLPFLLEFFLLLLVEQAVGHGGDVLFGQRVFIGDDDFAVDAKGRRHADDQVEVRGVEFFRGGQQPIQVFSAHAHRLKSCRHQPRNRGPNPVSERLVQAPDRPRLALRGLSCCAWV